MNIARLLHLANPICHIRRSAPGLFSVSSLHQTRQFSEHRNPRHLCFAINFNGFNLIPTNQLSIYPKKHVVSMQLVALKSGYNLGLSRGFYDLLGNYGDQTRWPPSWHLLADLRLSTIRQTREQPSLAIAPANRVDMHGAPRVFRKV
jgi:hypothetical protein